MAQNNSKSVVRSSNGAAVAAKLKALRGIETESTVDADGMDKPISVEARTADHQLLCFDPDQLILDWSLNERKEENAEAAILAKMAELRADGYIKTPMAVGYIAGRTGEHVLRGFLRTTALLRIKEENPEEYAEVWQGRVPYLVYSGKAGVGLSVTEALEIVRDHGLEEPLTKIDVLHGARRWAASRPGGFSESAFQIAYADILSGLRGGIARSKWNEVKATLSKEGFVDGTAKKVKGQPDKTPRYVSLRNFIIGEKPFKREAQDMAVMLRVPLALLPYIEKYLAGDQRLGINGAKITMDDVRRWAENAASAEMTAAWESQLAEGKYVPVKMSAAPEAQDKPLGRDVLEGLLGQFASTSFKLLLQHVLGGKVDMSKLLEADSFLEENER